ncbi:CinA family protein [Methylophaga sp. OBS3]|uniref:CinA family protein n=1 Tax=Methylophaga sp. OBS3 TaxID=2991934 RepID=UPI002B1CAC9A|nr:CinA family protein [Methylophaga sp. OBS3]
MRMPTIADDTLYQLTEQLATELLKRNWQLVTTESCTGGWLAKCCTDLAGSSAWFGGGVISYTNALKQALLGVKTDTLSQFGAVSEAVATEMAVGGLTNLGGDISVGISGIAGPTGGSPEKPVGLVCFGFASANQQFSSKQLFDGNRDEIRRQAIAFALNQLIKMLE